MEANDDAVTHFYIHTLLRTAAGQLELGEPEAVRIEGVPRRGLPTAAT